MLCCPPRFLCQHSLYPQAGGTILIIAGWLARDLGDCLGFVVRQTRHWKAAIWALKGMFLERLETDTTKGRLGTQPLKDTSIRLSLGCCVSPTTAWRSE